jgi:4-amino-4-deoxy-L-arabinose transferase-like glycosyltransferase
MMKINPFAILVVILILGTVVRVYDLSNNPSGFVADEAVIGINADTILTKGTDQYGVPFPVFFKAFGEYKSSLEIYLAVPFVILFGLNEFSVRVTSAVIGVICIVVIYFFVGELLKKQKMRTEIALFSAFFLAISPWHIHFSRIGWDAYMPFILLAMLATYVFLKAQENPRLLPLSVALFGIAAYAYFPARIFIPLFGLGLFIFYFKFFWTNRKQTLISLFVLIIILTPFISFHLKPEGLARWNQVNVFSHPPQDGTIFSHIVHNYLSHFSLDFLFLKGDIDMPGQFIPRHSVRGIGELYLFQLPLIILGFFILWRKPYKDALIIMSLWLLLYPLGSAFTSDLSAQATRSVIGVIPFQILAAIGLGSLFSSKFKTEKKNIVLSIAISIIIIISFSQYLNLYFIEYPKYVNGLYGWQFGAREVLQYFMSVEADYDQLIMSHTEFNAPESFIPFYSQNYRKGCTKCIIGLFDKYDPKKKQLFAVTPYNLAEAKFKATFVTLKTIYFPNGDVAFLIGTIPNTS